MQDDALQDRLFSGVIQELIKMRRNPALFSAGGLIQCKFCGKPKTALALLHASFQDSVGSWCADHGWLYFDSVKLPPTERLRASEIEDRRLEQRRKRGPRK